ncbi:hypothetical protein [Undibacterium baiyunense]|uniref:Uncharacterized protein n=1 Tax=Undibacterium baiyunense TaxID=2828731 RepID=A0A941DGS7_9BURK|nr:hypothetical protein [Undibacterium baiyunense]MBR7747821.1 hypothetical protein [Undibacterium baiyunense]
MFFSKPVTREDFKALALELEALGVPKNYFSIGHTQNERTCLVEENGKWLVFHSEKGQMADLVEFNSFKQAKSHLLALLKP